MAFIEIGRARQIQSLRAELKAYSEKYVQLQSNVLNILSGLEERTSQVTGNLYKTYETTVNEISKKYNNQSDWGCGHTGTIIDLRAAFIFGEGVKINHTTKTKAEAQAELDWSGAFLDWNDLDSEMAFQMAVEAEIEGKIAIKLFPDKAEDKFKGYDGMISARYIPWTEYKYDVKANEGDYLDYKTLEWKAVTTGGTQIKAEKLEASQFVYKKFGGRIHNPNQAQPKISKCLTQIERLDRALYDLRLIDHLFSSPTPHIECVDKRQVEEVGGQIDNINWKFGKLLVHTGKFEILGVDPSGVDNLIKEIEHLVKFVSGVTGIPIHFLGLLDLLKNRATGDNTRELVMAATQRERTIWEGAYNELLVKGMEMFNKETGLGQKSTKLIPERVKATIPVITQEHWDRIEKVLIPAATGGILTKQYVASVIPGVDMEEEETRREEEDERAEEKAQQELERVKAERDLNENQANNNLNKNPADRGGAQTPR